jgi:glycerophosphoryl diester phosphodiesterase
VRELAPAIFLALLLAGCHSSNNTDEGADAPAPGAFLEGNWYPDRHPLNIAHRGGAIEFPENTLYAYKQSLAVAGAHMLEMDIYETADGELVVIHDSTVDRTTNGSGDVSSFTLAQLKALDAAHCFMASHGSDCGGDGPFPLRGIATGEKAPPAGFDANDFRIPTLREILEEFPQTLINIELKPDIDSTGSYEQKLATLLAEFGRGNDVIVASFQDWNSLFFKVFAPAVSTSVPTGQVALFVASGLGPLPGLTAGHQAFQVPPALGIPVVSQDFVNDAHALNLAVHVWTINDCATMVDLLHLGVDGIMTDAPSLLRQVLAQPAGEWNCEQVEG